MIALGFKFPIKSIKQRQCSSYSKKSIVFRMQSTNPLIASNISSILSTQNSMQTPKKALSFQIFNKKILKGRKILLKLKIKFNFI